MKNGKKEFVELVPVGSGYAYRLEVERSLSARQAFPGEMVEWYHITVITPDNRIVNVTPGTNHPDYALADARKKALSKIEELQIRARGKSKSSYVPDELQSEGQLAMPTDLSPAGQRAYGAIMKLLVKHLDGLPDAGAAEELTGGCRAFYSGRDWTARGGEYGQRAELVVVYDGGYLYDLFNEVPAFGDELAKELETFQLYYEHGTSWMGGVYPL
jgi:hypothetical protein